MRIPRFQAVALLIAAPLAAQTVESVEVTPNALTVTAGERASFSAVARDAAGHAVPSARFTWLATPFDIAGSDSTGVVTTTRPGRTFVVAVAAGKVGLAQLDIRERPPVRLELDGPDTLTVGGIGTLTLRGRTVL